MNAPLRTAVYGAVFGLALALNTAAAQDQDQTGPTTALPESSNTPAPKAESKPAASKPEPAMAAPEPEAESAPAPSWASPEPSAPSWGSGSSNGGDHG